MQKENYTILLGIEILFLSFFATAICLSFDLWQPAGGTLPIRGCMIWEPKVETLEQPVSWAQNLRDFYIPSNSSSNPWTLVRATLSLLPWTFFGLAMCHVVYTHVKENRLIDPLSAGLMAAQKLLPFWLGGALSIGLAVGLWIVYKLHPNWSDASIGSITAFYLCVLGFGIAFIINLITLSTQNAKRAYDSQHQNDHETLWQEWTWEINWLLWRCFEGLLAALFSYIPMLALAMFFHYIICFMVFGTHPWIPLRKEAGTMSVLSFIPLVILNGFFWALMTRMYIKIHATSHRQ